MASPIKEFGDTAKGLAKNPLGIIALFIVLIYGFASFVVGASSQLQPNERLPIVWFLVIFPGVVLGVFAWLVSKHHKKLYAPSDFKDEAHFLESINPNLSSLSLAKPSPETEIGLSELPSTINFSNVSPLEWSKQRNNIYAENRGYFLAHVIEPSQDKGQLYNVFIYLIRHKSQDFGDIDKAEFFFGHYWGNKIYEGSKVGKLIGVKTSAYGPFLALCRITFKDGNQTTLNRYIDFEMGQAVQKIMNR